MLALANPAPDPQTGSHAAGPAGVKGAASSRDSSVRTVRPPAHGSVGPGRARWETEGDMTRQRRFKQRVRERTERTGERYAAARRGLLGEFPEPSRRDEAARSGEAEAPTAPVGEFGVADDRVFAATGRGRREWFALLDAAGAGTMSHRDIAAWLQSEHGVAGWWAQTVTVDYEQARGRRARHERPDGFSISKSRTMAAPVARVYDAWVDPGIRETWLPEELAVSSTREHRSVRGAWGDGSTRIAVGLTPKGEARTQVAVQHEKLPDADTAERMKTVWAAHLEALARALE